MPLTSESHIILGRYLFGSIVAHYLQPSGSSRCELHLIPASAETLVVDPRRTMAGRAEVDSLPAKFHPVFADSPNSVVQLKLREDNTGSGFSSGKTMVESATMTGLEYIKQEVFTAESSVEVATTLRDHAGRFRCIHRLVYQEGETGLTSSVDFINDGVQPLSLELLTSFAMNGITPFFSANSTPHLQFHRFRSWWSQEGRTDSISLETLHLERSWAGFSQMSERFGQVGTMPARQWFPTAAVEDKTQGVVWAAQLAWAGSWQMELIRRGDRVTLCGGLADREFGHWIRLVNPGETFSTPKAYLTVVAGTVDDACQALLDKPRRAAKSAPECERNLPATFNEWCTSWGSPSHENIIAIAQRLEGSGVRYIVIDDGWTSRPPEAFIQNNGEWLVDEKKFPHGLKATCDALRNFGFIPGIWFEFEVVNDGVTFFNEHHHLLQRDGRTLQVGSRRFWDLNDPWVLEYLTRKVINQLRENGIGYLKVDYNDNIGLGCDHADSLGEGLRRHVDGIHRFFKTLRTALPDLVIENCSSGGHRLEPSMQELTSMGSFSDAHEATIIPVIARNLQRLILPQQSLIWAVLHPSDDADRLCYSLAATFLGRICLSGDIHNLSDWQMDIARGAIALYAQTAELIKHGRSFFHGSEQISYVDPTGWQIVVRENHDSALVVAHCFGDEISAEIQFDLPKGKWVLTDRSLNAQNTLTISCGTVGHIRFKSAFQGAVWILQREPELQNVC